MSEIVVGEVVKNIQRLHLDTKDESYANPGNVDALLILFSHIQNLGDVVRMSLVHPIWLKAADKYIRHLKVIDLSFLSTLKTEKDVEKATKFILNRSHIDILECVIVNECLNLPWVITQIARCNRELPKLVLDKVKSTKEICMSIKRIKCLNSLVWTNRPVFKLSDRGYFCNTLDQLYKLKTLELKLNYEGVIQTRPHQMRDEMRDENLKHISVKNVNDELESLHLASPHTFSLFSMFCRIFSDRNERPPTRDIPRVFKLLKNIELRAEDSGYTVNSRVPSRVPFIDTGLVPCFPCVESLIIGGVDGYQLPLSSLLKMTQLNKLDITGCLTLHATPEADFVSTTGEIIMISIDQLSREVTKMAEDEPTVLTTLKYLALRSIDSSPGDRSIVIQQVSIFYSHGRLANPRKVLEEFVEHGIPIPVSCHAPACRHILPKFTALETVILHTVPQFAYTDFKLEGLEIWGEILRKNRATIKHLEINGGVNVENDWLTLVGLELTKLQYVSVKMCKSVTKEGVEELLNALNKKYNQHKITHSHFMPGTSEAHLTINITHI